MRTLDCETTVDMQAMRRTYKPVVLCASSCPRVKEAAAHKNAVSQAAKIGPGVGSVASLP